MEIPFQKSWLRTLWSLGQWCNPFKFTALFETLEEILEHYHPNSHSYFTSVPPTASAALVVPILIIYTFSCTWWHCSWNYSLFWASWVVAVLKWTGSPSTHIAAQHLWQLLDEQETQKHKNSFSWNMMHDIPLERLLSFQIGQLAKE